MARYNGDYILEKDGTTKIISTLKEVAKVVGCAEYTARRYMENGSSYNGWMIKRDIEGWEKRKKKKDNIRDDLFKKVIAGAERKDTIEYIMETYGHEEAQAERLWYSLVKEVGLGARKRETKQEEEARWLKIAMEEPPLKEEVIKKKSPMKHSGRNGFCWVETSYRYEKGC